MDLFQGIFPCHSFSNTITAIWSGNVNELLSVYDDMKLPIRNRLVSYEYFFSCEFPKIMAWDCNIPFTFREYRFEIPSLRLMMNNQYNTWDAVDRTLWDDVK